MEQRKIDTLSYQQKKELCLKATANGVLLYKKYMPGLRRKNEFQFYNESSLFRKDKNPSQQLQLNRSTNIWYHHDYGAPQYSGDVFDFTASLYGMDVKKDFKKVIDKIIEVTGLIEAEDAVIEKFLNRYDGTTDDIIYDFKIKDLNTSNLSFKIEVEKPENEYAFTVNKIDFEKLSEKANEWLSEYGITKEAMTACRASFISGYTKIFDDKKEHYTKPRHSIMLAYEFNYCYKFYIPYPKKFWYIGHRMPDNCFGEKAIIKETDKQIIVILTGGEKDVLTLVSRGFNAICLNSETQAISTAMNENWQRQNFRIVVLYDIDDTGISEAKKINQQFNYPYVILSQSLKEKGGKDVADFFKFGGTKEELQRLIDDAVATKESSKIEDKRLSMRTASQRLNDAKKLPDIKPFADVLFQSNELVILFGDTGKGKSILAVALADAISKGESFLQLENHNGSQIVLYYDYELSDKQFEKRYRDQDGFLYEFSDKMFIDNVDLSQIDLSDKNFSFEEHIINMMRSHIADTGASVLIIDNITFLVTHSPEDGQIAMNLMKLLKQLKSDLNISILVLAHTPKKFGAGGIGLPDLAGSKHLSNFADSVFALGASKRDNNLRYLIQVKPSRSGEVKYDSENVLVCEIQKTGVLLTFVHRGFAKESEHLISNNQEVEEELITQAKKLQQQGKTIREIADILKVVSKSTVGRWLQTK